MPTATERPRLRDLRLERGWTQQDVAERVNRLAWTRLHEQAAVNADMVAKWERGAKVPSPRYRKLLALVFDVTVDQLGLRGVRHASSRADDESLVAMVDRAAELLNDLGVAGRAVRTQVLAALTDEVLTRRTTFAMLNDSTRGTAAPPTEATVADFERLAGQYERAHATVTPAALMTAVAGHLRAVSTALAATRSAGVRQRLLRNRARVAVLAGRLAAEDLGSPMAARAYYAQAADDAHENNEPAVAAIAAGYAAKLAIQDGQPTAALARLRAAADLVTDPALCSWLAGIEATAHADLGHHDAARAALTRAQDRPTTRAAVPWFHDHDAARLAAVAGHVLVTIRDADAARQLADAAAQVRAEGPAGRRALVLCLLDLAHAQVHAGRPDAALNAATEAAELTRRTPYALGAAGLHALRQALNRHSADPAALRALDEQLSELAA